jgi:hypothetical protein
MLMEDRALRDVVVGAFAAEDAAASVGVDGVVLGCARYTVGSAEDQVGGRDRVVVDRELDVQRNVDDRERPRPQRPFGEAAGAEGVAVADDRARTLAVADGAGKDDL